MPRKKTQLPRPELNITSMMDLVLNLLTFFVLVSNFAAAELPGLTPPDPDDSRARVSEAANKFTINVIPDPRDTGRAQWVQVGVEKLDPRDTIALVDKLRREVKISPNVEVNLRADRALRYQEVQPVMAAITQAGITRVNVVAQMRP